MGLFDKLEQRLERTVNGAFAKAFRSEVQPVEIASAMRRSMDNRASSIGKDQRPIVPNVFDVELSNGDFERLTAYREELSDELIASAMEHADTQRYTAGGPVAVTFSENPELETGVFHIRTGTAKHVEGLQPLQRAVDPEPDNEYEDPAATEYEAQGPAPVQAAGAGAPPQSAQPQPAQLPGYGATADTPDPREEAPAPPARPAPKAPRARPRPWLEIDGERYPLLTAMTVIGRDDSADIVLDDPGISRQHTEIRVTHDGPHLVVSLRDLGSTNGTFVNGDPVSRARLVEGDRITVGRTAFTLHLGGRR